MADDTASVRQRKPAQEVEDDETLFASTPAEASQGKKVKKSKKAKREEETEEYSPWVDILRLLSFLALASCALSYLISGGESFFWGFQNKPWYLRPDYWKSKFVRLLLAPPPFTGPKATVRLPRPS